MNDAEVMATYPTGTRVCRVEDERDAGAIVAYDRDEHGMLVAVWWETAPGHLGYQTWLRPERLRPIGA